VDSTEREEFWVDPKRYYSEVEIRDDVAGAVRLREDSYEHRVEIAMSNVIKRYELSGKNILSLASGAAFEEYWMLRAGNRVTCVDDFSDHRGISRVQAATTAKESSAFRYVKSDFYAFVAQSEPEPFDVCYISSFPPDEYAREEIQAAYRARLTQDEKFSSYKSWPDGMPPFLQPMMDARKLISPGGLLLIQSYRGGVDIKENRHYPGMIEEQMAKNDLALLEIHYFRQSPGIVLIAAAAGLGHQQQWRERLDRAAPITEFHGRYPHDSMRREVELWTVAAKRKAGWFFRKRSS
jgi:hypothetical protein